MSASSLNDVPRADPSAPVILDGLVSQHADADPVETGEWLDGFDAVVARGGPARARFLMLKVLERARQRQIGLPSLALPNSLASGDFRRPTWRRTGFVRRRAARARKAVERTGRHKR